MLNQESVQSALKSVKYPGFSRDIISFGIVKHVAAGDGAVSVQLQLTTANPDIARQIREECERVLRALPGVEKLHLEIKIPPARIPPPSRKTPGPTRTKFPASPAWWPWPAARAASANRPAR